MLTQYFFLCKRYQHARDTNAHTRYQHFRDTDTQETRDTPSRLVSYEEVILDNQMSEK